MADPRLGDGAGPSVVNQASVGTQINPVGGQHTFNVHTFAAPRPEPRKTNLPPRPERFVGRDGELAEIRALLLGGAQVSLNQRAAKPGGLTGLGGVGKTTLAAEYAHRYLTEYQQICWVNAEGQDPSAAFGALADDPLRLGSDAGATVAERVVAVKQHLEQARGPVLLIFDNVDHPKGWRALVPAGTHIRVLVTTRREDLPGVRKVRVEVLPEDQALELILGDLTVLTAERDAARALCQELGCLTLAVALAGRLLEQAGARPSALLARVRNSGPVTWSEHPRGEDLLSKNPSLTRLFDASVALLDEGRPLDAHARRLFWVGGWFAPVEIPRDVFLDAGLRLAGDAVAAELGEDALARLVDLGLVQLDDDGRPRLHQLVMAYARARGGEAVCTAVLDALGAVASATDAETMALCGLASVAPHMAVATSWLDGQSPEAHLLIAIRLAQHYRTIALYADSLAVHQLLVPALGERLWASYFLNEAGQALTSMGRYVEAINLYQQDLAIKEKMLGPEHPDTAITLGVIGRALARQGKYTEALEYYGRSLEIQEKTLGSEHPDTAITLSAIGQALAPQGKYAEALEYYERSLAIKEKARGPEHPDTAITLADIGLVLTRQGKYAMALDFYRRCRAIQEKALGPEHPSMAITLHAIGQALALPGKYAEAFDFYKRSLAIKEKTLGPEHPETVITQFELGRCKRALGDPDGLRCMQEAADRLERLMGSEHPRVKAARSWLS